jgi:hypothetical protein
MHTIESSEASIRHRRSRVHRALVAICAMALGGSFFASTSCNAPDPCELLCEKQKKCNGLPTYPEDCTGYCADQEGIASDDLCVVELEKLETCLSSRKDVCNDAATACEKEVTALNNCEDESGGWFPPL